MYICNYTMMVTIRAYTLFINPYSDITAYFKDMCSIYMQALVSSSIPCGYKYQHVIITCAALRFLISWDSRNTCWCHCIDTHMVYINVINNNVYILHLIILCFLFNQGNSLENLEFLPGVNYRPRVCNLFVETVSYLYWYMSVSSQAPLKTWLAVFFFLKTKYHIRYVQ